MFGGWLQKKGNDARAYVGECLADPFLQGSWIGALCVVFNNGDTQKHCWPARPEPVGDRCENRRIDCWRDWKQAYVGADGQIGSQWSILRKYATAGEDVRRSK
jgi:hypothetical protein